MAVRLVVLSFIQTDITAHSDSISLKHNQGLNMSKTPENQVSTPVTNDEPANVPPSIFVVMSGGCVRYVSTDSSEIASLVSVKVIDLDEGEDDEDRNAALALAEKSVHIW
jgi:hypothetical protein